MRLLVDSRSTKCSRWTSVLVPLVLAIAGCDVTRLAIPASENRPKTTSNEVRLSAADLGSRLALRVDDTEIRVGNLAQDVFQGSFARPPRAVQWHELPPTLDESFGSDGWETPDRSLSLVSKDGSVVMAIYTTQTNAAADFDEATKHYEYALPTQPLVRKDNNSEYRFWTDGAVTLMLCWFQDGKASTFSQVIGLSRLMRDLRMDPDSAEQDARTALDLIRKRQSATNKG